MEGKESHTHTHTHTQRTPYMMGCGREGEDTLHDGGWEGGRGHPT